MLFINWIERHLAEITSLAMVLTESKSLGTARLQNKRCDGHERQQTAGYDEVRDVIERFAAKMESESNPGKRSTARIGRCRLGNWNIWYKDEQIIISHTQPIAY